MALNLFFLRGPFQASKNPMCTLKQIKIQFYKENAVPVMARWKLRARWAGLWARGSTLRRSGLECKVDCVTYG